MITVFLNVGHFLEQIVQDTISSSKMAAISTHDQANCFNNSGYPRLEEMRLVFYRAFGDNKKGSQLRETAINNNEGKETRWCRWD